MGRPRTRFIPQLRSPWTPGLGYDGTIESNADLAKCSTERQALYVQSLQALLATATREVKNGPETYRKTVEGAEDKLAKDREWLAFLMAAYIDASHVFARSAAQALEGGAPCDSGSDAEREDPRSGAEAEGPQSGGEAASPKPTPDSQD